MAQCLKGGVIMDVVTPEEARIAEEAGAVAVMALERVPADIRKQGGVARMSDPEVVRGCAHVRAASPLPACPAARPPLDHPALPCPLGRSTRQQIALLPSLSSCFRR